jgi:hypothetical protein
MCLDCTPGHLELGRNFCIVTALQQQFRNLLLSRAQANRLFLHVNFLRGKIITDAVKGVFHKSLAASALRRPAA